MLSCVQGTAFDCSIVHTSKSMMTLQVSGKKAAHVFRDEPGGHRWQRVPQTEKRGRVHTSTITVAVFKEPTQTEIKLDHRELEITTCRGSGAGGQHRNTTDSAVQVKHVPTGTIVRCESERSQHQNKLTAIGLLRGKLAEAAKIECRQIAAHNKKQQVGSGMRGDKRRTIRQHDGYVNDHVSGRSWQYNNYVKGNW